MKKILSTLFIAIVLTGVAKAQYKIYPIPQSIVATENVANIPAQMHIVCDPDIDAATINRAKQILSDHGIEASTTATAPEGAATLWLKTDAAVKVEGKYDAHQISLSSLTNGTLQLTITGQNTDAVFFGLATIEQILDQCGDSLTGLKITDYADQQQRGLVEGYYGYPYSVEVKKDLMRFMMRMKMNTYLYGAKSDPYHSDYWAQPYPDAITDQQEENGWMTQSMIRDICDVSASTKVNFIWAIHPGNQFISSSTVVSDIMGKFEKMYSLGVRQFGVFVDDVGVPSSDADMATNASRLTQLQQNIEQKWNTAGALPADTVKPIHFVPQIYCRGFAKDEDQYSRFFRALANTPDNVIIYTTGNGVWSVPNNADLATPRNYLRRSVAWWWNYPCNDNADAQIYPMSMYTNFSHMPAVSNNATLPSDLQNGLGVVSNPMQQGELAKIALFSVADYAWNNSGFNNMQSWEASFPFILDPEAAQALRNVAPYLTKYDPADSFGASLGSDNMIAKANSLLESIATLRGLETSKNESDRLMWRDIKSWTLKLEAMLHSLTSLLSAKEGTDIDTRWADYETGASFADSLLTKEDYIVYTLEGKGANVPVSAHITMPAQSYLAPCINSLLKSAASDMFDTGAPVCVSNMQHSGRIYSNNGTYISLSNQEFAPGDYIGIAMPKPQVMQSLIVSDALCSKIDVMYSPDGRNWNPIIPTGSNRKTIEEMIKFIVVINNSNENITASLTRGSLFLTPMTEPTIESFTTSSNANDYNNRANAYDGDYTTWWAMNKNQANGDQYILKLSQPVPLDKVRVGIGTTNGDYVGTARIEISTDSAKWTRINTSANKSTFNINDMATLTDECKVIDLYAKGQTAQYIRLYNQSARAGKWLRVHEIEPFYAVVQEPAGHAEVSDRLPYTYTLYNSSTPLVYTTTEMAEVTGVTLYTDKGIIDLNPTFEADGTTFQVEFDTDTKVYEVILHTGTTPDELTAINSAKTATPDTPGATPAYDLQGRIAMPGSKGIMIINGQKIAN